MYLGKVVRLKNRLAAISVLCHRSQFNKGDIYPRGVSSVLFVLLPCSKTNRTFETVTIEKKQYQDSISSFSLSFITLTYVLRDGFDQAVQAWLDILLKRCPKCLVRPVCLIVRQIGQVGQTRHIKVAFTCPLRDYKKSRGSPASILV